MSYFRGRYDILRRFIQHYIVLLINATDIRAIVEAPITNVGWISERQAARFLILEIRGKELPEYPQHLA